MLAVLVSKQRYLITAFNGTPPRVVQDVGCSPLGLLAILLSSWVRCPLNASLYLFTLLSRDTSSVDKMYRL